MNLEPIHTAPLTYTIPRAALTQGTKTTYPAGVVTIDERL
jgi:hypothetical protein